MNVNKVIIAGTLTRDPELRYIPNGTAVTKISLAINRTYKSKEGTKEEVAFVNVTIWGKRAELVANSLAKGKQLYVEGRLIYRSWEGRDGQKRSVLEVVAENIQFIGYKNND